MSRWPIVGLLLAAALVPAAAVAGVVNPDISVVGQPFLRWTDDPGDAARERASLELGETEFVFDSYLNPYARGTFTVALHDEHVHLEEATFSLLRGLPGGLELKGGRYRAGFGRLNPEHPHTYPFAERFRVLAAYLPGDEALIETGVGVSARLALAGDASLTAAADWLQGDTFQDGTDAHDEAEAREDTTESGPRPAALGRLSAFVPLGERSGLDLGLSALHGTNDVAAATRTNVFGADAKAKLWRSPRSYLLLQAELLHLDREEAHRQEGGTDVEVHRRTPWGGYAFADYCFGPRYDAGVSWERWQRATADGTWDQALGVFAGLSLMEETTTFRLGWERYLPGAPDAGPADPAVDTVTLRVIYSMGPHRAHRF